MAKITAIIDIGSNSARVAIFQKSSRFGFHLIKELKSGVRISEKSYENGGVLQEAALNRAYEAIRDFIEISKRFGAKKFLCVATSALRDAPNGSFFVNKIKRDFGINIRVINGEKEAFYGAVAALNLLPIEDGFTVDIGGGSCDCAFIKDGKIESLYTLNLGTIRLKELFYDKKRDIKEAITFVRDELNKLPKSIDTKRAIGIGGTIRAISKAILRSSNYPIELLHGYRYETKDCIEYIDTISKCEVRKLKKLGIKQDRFDTIRGGALIFLEILKRFEFSEIITSGVGIREGVYLGDMLRNSNYKFPQNFNPSVRSLCDRFGSKNGYREMLVKFALEIFDTLKPIHNIEDSYKFHLKTAAKLCDIGIALSFYENHHHGKYFLLNSLNYGFWHRDRAVIALLVEYQYKKIPKDSSIESIKNLLPPLETLQWLSFILGIAHTINSNLTSKNIEFSYEHQALCVKSDKSLYLAKEESKNIAKPVPIGIVFKKL